MRTVKVQSGQTLWDIAVQHCGSADAVFDLAKENGMSPDATLVPGSVLTIPEPCNKKVAGYYSGHNVNPASAVDRSSDSSDIPGHTAYTFSWSGLKCVLNAIWNNYSWGTPVCVLQETPCQFSWSELLCALEEAYGFAWDEPECVLVNMDYDFSWCNHVCVLKEPYGFKWSEARCAQGEGPCFFVWSNPRCVLTDGPHSFKWSEARCALNYTYTLEWEDIV